MSELDIQNECIKEICADFAAFLVKKNTSYSGSVFRDMNYAGTHIPAEQTINTRITDKIKRLQSTDFNFDGEDSEADLLGYLLLKRAVKKYLGVGASDAPLAEHKRKVALYQWAVRYRRSGRFVQLNSYYATETEVKSDYPCLVSCLRLDYTKIEIEEKKPKL